ncbi:hypothetical protein C8R45DRAFT_1112360 [Mycena sanguinolenta]|nr:hypothetical protein C8R45DRAFT_1112360 [Mycena sanguinolenta]
MRVLLVACARRTTAEGWKGDWFFLFWFTTAVSRCAWKLCLSLSAGPRLLINSGVLFASCVLLQVLIARGFKFAIEPSPHPRGLSLPRTSSNLRLLPPLPIVSALSPGNGTHASLSIHLYSITLRPYLASHRYCLPAFSTPSSPPSSDALPSRAMAATITRKRVVFLRADLRIYK